MWNYVVGVAFFVGGMILGTITLIVSDLIVSKNFNVAIFMMLIGVGFMVMDISKHQR